MWFAQAPSNIALIKYMGKADSTRNLPVNASLSYTLPNLLSFVELEKTTVGHDAWEPLQIPGKNVLMISEQAQQRFLEHFSYLKKYFNCEAHFIVRSSNNFPSNCGLASSASSFAALTIATIRAMVELMNIDEPDIQTQSSLSRAGSGSSCRSFFPDWVSWQDDKIQHETDIPYQNLHHQVVLLSQEEKSISSSNAHEHVRTSPEFNSRINRANDRFKKLKQALISEQWQTAYQISWDEFTDMHRLFETSVPPFSYQTDTCKQLLEKMQTYWQLNNDGPIVTMDAGPNIHLLFRHDQTELAIDFKQRLLFNADIL